MLNASVYTEQLIRGSAPQGRCFTTHDVRHIVRHALAVAECRLRDELRVAALEAAGTRQTMTATAGQEDADCSYVS